VLTLARLHPQPQPRRRGCMGNLTGPFEGWSSGWMAPVLKTAEGKRSLRRLRIPPPSVFGTLLAFTGRQVWLLGKGANCRCVSRLFDPNGAMNRTRLAAAV